MNDPLGLLEVQQEGDPLGLLATQPQVPKQEGWLDKSYQQYKEMTGRTRRDISQIPGGKTALEWTEKLFGPETPIGQGAEQIGMLMGTEQLGQLVGKIPSAIKHMSKLWKTEKTFGGFQHPLEAGEVAKKEAWEMAKSFRDKADLYYDAVGVKPTQKIITKNLTDTAQANAETLGRLESPTVKKILEKVQTGSQEPWYTWQELRGDLSELGKMANKTKDWNTKRILNDLKDAGYEDINVFGQVHKNPEIQTKLARANQFYKEGDKWLPGVEVWKDRQIINMMQSTSPEDIINVFFKPKANMSDLGRLKRVVGDYGFQELKRGWAKQLLGGEEGQFNGKFFRDTYDAYRKGGNLKIILTPEERTAFDKLYKHTQRKEFVIKAAEYGAAGTAWATGGWLAYYELRKLLGI